jgi:hypothetical protein
VKKRDDQIDINSILISINDIRDKFFEGQELNPAERQALHNYDKFRLTYLNGSKDEKDFDYRYFQLQVMANLHPFTDFVDYENIPHSKK